jgi:hypothetical protein
VVEVQLADALAGYFRQSPFQCWFATYRLGMLMGFWMDILGYKIVAARLYLLASQLS